VDTFESIRRALAQDPSNAVMTEQHWEPLYAAATESRIVIIAQAPGRKAQATGVPWDDASGSRLMAWLGVTEQEFRDPRLFALLPMDFYYPGRGRSGDLPPRPGFADLWHPPLLALMPHIRLTLLIGKYAQAHYLPQGKRATLTETVRNFREFLPDAFPLVHPSPLNFRWQTKNPWFTTEVLPELRALVRSVLGDPLRSEN
jgi:uracil-DNA glycosylase